MTPDDFGVFILSHGRADNVQTVPTLRRGNYTGKICIVIDNEDESGDEYRKNYGSMENVCVYEFDRSVCDNINGDNRPDRKTVTFARNETFRIAKEFGWTHFLMLEDDYGGIYYRYPDGPHLKALLVPNLDELFQVMTKFLIESNATTICFAQAGDYIGGLDKYNEWGNKSRKVMNSFFCTTDKPFRFLGRMNDDVNMYVVLSSRGHLFYTTRDVAINQGGTQANAGGMTTEYLSSGTYVKSFYSVMMAPSCVRVDSMGWHFRRIHHKVYFNNLSPKIVSDDYKKSDKKVVPICKEYIV